MWIMIFVEGVSALLCNNYCDHACSFTTVLIVVASGGQITINPIYFHQLGHRGHRGSLS